MTPINTWMNYSISFSHPNKRWENDKKDNKMTTYFSLHDFVRTAKEHPKTKGWRISMTDVHIDRAYRYTSVIVIDNGDARLFISTIDTELKVYTIDEGYTAWEIRNHPNHENPESIPGFEQVLTATIIHPSPEYGDIDDIITTETNNYIKNTIASVFTELRYLGNSGQLRVFKEILESSIIDADTVEDARARVKRYSGKGVRLRELVIGVVPDDMFPVASTISIIKELHKLKNTWGYSYSKAHARFQMGLVELAQRELSLQEMNFFLNGRIENDITTTESSFLQEFRQSSIDSDTNPYSYDTSLIRDLEESFLDKIAEERRDSVIIIEPNKITPGIENDVNAGEYKIAIKANVPVSPWDGPHT